MITALAIANIALWLVGVGLELFTGEDWVQLLGARISSAIWEGQVWRLLSAVFLHAGAAHLAFNTWALLSVGPAVEASFGSARTLGIYLAAGVAGNAASTLWGGEASVGASGAIFGCLGALLQLGLRFRHRFGRRFWSSLLPTIAANLAYGLFTPRIDNWAHVGGLAGGFLTAYALGGARLPARAAAIAALVALTAWSAAPPRWFLLYRAGREAVAAARYAEAEGLLREAAALQPRSPQPLLLLYVVYAQTGRREEAIAVLERGLRLQPEHPLLRRWWEEQRRFR